MTFTGFKDWIMLGLLTVGVYFVGNLASGVNDLNLKMAVFTEKVLIHDRQLEKHDNRIERLEHKR
jgi:hypothetical protein